MREILERFRIDPEAYGPQEDPLRRLERMAKVHIGPALQTMREDYEEGQKRALSDPTKLKEERPLLPPVAVVEAGLDAFIEKNVDPILEDYAQWREESGRANITWKTDDTSPR